MRIPTLLAKPLYAMLNHIPKLLVQDKCDKQANAAGTWIPMLLAKPLHAMLNHIPKLLVATNKQRPQGCGYLSY
jgi:hypothetical protein